MPLKIPLPLAFWWVEYQNIRPEPSLLCHSEIRHHLVNRPGNYLAVKTFCFVSGASPSYILKLLPDADDRHKTTESSNALAHRPRSYCSCLPPFPLLVSR